MPTASTIRDRVRRWLDRVRSGPPGGWPPAPVGWLSIGRRPPPGQLHDHTVLLGWSPLLSAILPVLVTGDRVRAPSGVAVLADQDRAPMPAHGQRHRNGGRPRAAPGRPREGRVAYHQGDPGDPATLARVRPQAARSVVILPPAGPPADRDPQLARILLALRDRGAGGAGAGQVLACVSDPANLPALRLAGGTAPRLVDVTDLAARLLVQTCLQPGLAAVYTDLLGTGGAQLHVRPEPTLVGHRYGQAVHAYRTAAVIGLRAGEGPIALNPHGQTPVRSGDWIIALAGDGEPVAPRPDPSPVAPPGIAGYADPPPGRSRVLVLGWNHRAGAGMFQLDQQLPPGSEVSVVTRHPAAAPVLGGLAGHLENLVLTFKDDDGADRAVLDSLGIGGYDRVLVLAEDDPQLPRLADARTLLTLLHLRSLRDQQVADPRWPSVVAELSDPTCYPQAMAAGADDLVVTDLLVGLLVARIASDPTGGPVFASLLDPYGARICLVPAERYVHPGQPVTFQTVVEAARWRWETAIGYRVAAGPAGPGGANGSAVVLHPDMTAPLALRAADQVIVLAGT